MSTALRAPHRMTVAEFQDWQPPPELADRRWELVDGEPICMAPPSLDHAAIQTEIGSLLRDWLLHQRLDCRVLTGAGVLPRMRSDTNERIPDLAVACGPFRSGRTIEAPLLLIEILSPSNETKTRANVWTYTTIPSVAEIVVISSTSITAELYRRNADGTWPSEPLYHSAEQELSFDSVGMKTALRAAYRTSSLA